MFGSRWPWNNWGADPAQVIDNIQYISGEGQLIQEGTAALHGPLLIKGLHWRRRASCEAKKSFMRNWNSIRKPKNSLCLPSQLTHFRKSAWIWNVLVSVPDHQQWGARQPHIKWIWLLFFSFLFFLTRVHIISWIQAHRRRPHWFVFAPFSFIEATWLPSTQFVLHRGAAVSSSKDVFLKADISDCDKKRCWPKPV